MTHRLTELAYLPIDEAPVSAPAPDGSGFPEKRNCIRQAQVSAPAPDGSAPRRAAPKPSPSPEATLMPGASECRVCDGIIPAECVGVIGHIARERKQLPRVVSRCPHCGDRIEGALIQTSTGARIVPVLASSPAPAA